MNDLELLLMSWVQMVASELIMTDEEHVTARRQLENTLRTDFGISDITLTSRTLDVYRVSYTVNGETKEAAFPVDDVESIFDF